MKSSHSFVGAILALIIVQHLAGQVVVPSGTKLSAPPGADDLISNR